MARWITYSGRRWLPERHVLCLLPGGQTLVIDDNGAVSMYDTGDVYLTGISEQQRTAQTLNFSSTDGPVPLSRFKRVAAS